MGFNLFIPVGTARTQIDALATGALGPIGFGTQNSISDRLTSFGDPAPQLSLKWNEGANNFMVYSRGGIPIGDYDPDRIVNLGDGHASWDNGFGYTYFNATTGFEFSAVSGLTYNFTNPHTDYQNGIDWHVDLEASRFFTKQFYVGAVGYTFNQLTGDTGSGATLGPYISRISAVGPEVGYLFPVGGMQGSFNLQGLLGICGSKPILRLEYVVGVFCLTYSEGANGRQITSGELRPRPTAATLTVSTALRSGQRGQPVLNSAPISSSGSRRSKKSGTRACAWLSCGRHSSRTGFDRPKRHRYNNITDGLHELEVSPQCKFRDGLNGGHS